MKVLAKQTKQLACSHRLMECRLDHHSLGKNQGQNFEDTQDTTLPDNLPKEKLAFGYCLGQ